jgi:hypothetical protein
MSEVADQLGVKYHVVNEISVLGVFEAFLEYKLTFVVNDTYDVKSLLTQNLFFGGHFSVIF